MTQPTSSPPALDREGWAPGSGWVRRAGCEARPHLGWGRGVYFKF